MMSKVRQRGVITIFISIIMLLLITVLVVTAFSLSTTNLRSVGNAEVRSEAIAAAQWYIEDAIQSDFTTEPNVPDDLIVLGAAMDIDDDGKTDFLVDREAPVCVRAERAITAASSSVTLPGFSAGSSWNTVWEIRAKVTEASTGAQVRVVQGIRILLTNTRKNLLCG